MARQAEINDVNLQMASNRIPPSWNPQQERTYSFRKYRLDLELWVAATDMDAARQGPAIAMRLGGDARQLAHELGTAVLVQGQVVADAAGQPMQITGVQVLLQELAARYAPLQQEEQLHAIHAIMSFRRHQGESTDDLCARFGIITQRATDVGGVNLPIPANSWILLNAMGTPRSQWPMLLAATGGALPATAPQFRAMVEYMRRQGHLNDRGIDPVKSLGFMTAHDDAPEPWHEEQQQDWGYFEQRQSQSEPAMSYTASESWDEDLSSGSSQQDELDFSDLTGMSDNEVGESLYLAYAFAKRRWRRFTGGAKGSKGPRKGSGKKSSKGPRKGPGGKHAPRAYTTSDASPDQWHAASDPWHLDFAEQHAFKGSSKGKARRGNPLGRDGKPLTCRVCNSTEHFAAVCPQSQGKGAGKASFMTEIMQQNQASSDYVLQHHFAATAPLPGSVSALFSAAQASAGSKIFYDDGSVETLQQPQMPTTPPATATSPKKTVSFGLLNMMWFEPTLLYHSSVRLKSGKEGLLVDCGAVGNLVGDGWCKRVASIALQQGHGSKETPLPKALSVGGVGKDSQEAHMQMSIPIALANGQLAVYNSPVVVGSELPALLGLETLEKFGALIDCKHHKIILPGPGGYQIKLSPASAAHTLEKAMSGHLLWPCTEWDLQQKGKPSAARLQL